MRAIVVILPGLLACGPLVAQDGAGIRIWKPQTIDKPGRYVVVRNISAPGTVLDIQSGDVRIDLGGFRLENTTDTGSVIQALPQQLQNVTIENGTLRGGLNCVFIDRVSGLTLRDLGASGCRNGIFLDDNAAATVEHNRIEAAELGIAVDDCASCRIADNVVLGGGESGIRVAIGDGGEIVGNRVRESTACLDVGGDGVAIRDNTVDLCEDGIRVRTEHGLVEGNLMAQCATGLRLTPESEGNVYRGNVSRGNGAGLVDEGEGNTSGGDNFLPDPR